MRISMDESVYVKIGQVLTSLPYSQVAQLINEISADAEEIPEVELEDTEE